MLVMTFFCDLDISSTQSGVYQMQGDAASGPATRDGQCYGTPGNKTFITKCADDEDVCVKFYHSFSSNAKFNTDSMVVAVQQPSAEFTSIFTVCIAHLPLRQQ